MEMPGVCYNNPMPWVELTVSGPALQRGPGGPRPTHFRPDDVIVTWRNR